MERAEELIKRYSKARLVVTSRLHCALPCVALGTPVIFVPKDKNDIRFKGYNEFLNIYSPEDLQKIDWNNPPKNKKPEELIKELEKRCEEFVE